MKKLSVSIESDHVDQLDNVQTTENLDSRSAALRHLVEEYETLQTECEALRTECENLRTRLEQREERIATLEEQLARRSEIEEKVDVLATRVETEQWASDAPFFVRWYRWWTSRKNGDESESGPEAGES